VSNLSNSRLFKSTSSGLETFSDSKIYIPTAGVEGGQVVDDDGYIRYDSRPSRANLELSINDVIFAKMKDSVKVLRASKELAEDYVFSTGFIRITPKFDLNSEFLKQVLVSSKFNQRKDSLAIGSTQPAIRLSDLSALNIPIPPLYEQRKIASVLYTVDQAIQKSENIIQQIKTIKQGIFQDFIYGAGSNRQFEEKMIGPRVVSLPKDWKVVQIEDALQRNIIFQQQDGNHGNNYPRKNEFVDRGVPYISAEMLSEGEVDFSKAKYLTEERANQLRIGFAKNGDVLLAHNATVGPTGLLETTSDFVIIGTSLTYYRCNPNEVSNQYMTYFFQSGTFQKQLQDVMRQSTRNQVPITRQRNLHLILPPIRQQREITNQIDAVNEKLQTENQYLGGFKRLKRGLMQDLLSGEVRTHDKDIELVDSVLQHG
jgi:type I restriction enzyme S subunit